MSQKIEEEKYISEHKIENLKVNVIEKNLKIQMEQVLSFDANAFCKIQDEQVNQSNIVLCDELYINPKNNSRTCKIQLSKQELIFFKIKSDQKLQVKDKFQTADIIGAKAHPNEITSHIYQLSIYLIVLDKASFFSKQKRSFLELKYYSNNYSKLKLWEALFLNIASDPDLLQNQKEYLLNRQLKVQRKRALVFLNPQSGSGQSKKKWAICKQYLEYGGFEFNEQNTLKPGFVNFYLNTLTTQDLLSYTCILSCSGDGVILELVNSLIQRQDYNQIQHIPIAQVPGGTGNALFTNECFESNQPIQMESIAYIICKGHSKKIDLMELDLSDEPKKLYSFLALEWAIIGTTDLDGEILRWLGSQRIFLYGAYKTIIQNNYYGRLYFTKDTVEKMPSINTEIPYSQITQQEGFLLPQEQLKEGQVNGDSQSQEKKLAEHQNAENPSAQKQNAEIPKVEKQDAEKQPIQNKSPTTEKQNPQKPKEENQSEKKQSVEQQQQQQHSNNSDNINNNKNEPQWYMVEDYFKFLNLTNMSFIDLVTYSSPLARTDDGFIDLQYLQGKQYVQLFKVMWKFQEGEHFDRENKKVTDGLDLQHHQVKAFRLIRYKDKLPGLLSIDGEKYDNLIIQGKILPKIFNILCL